MPHHEAWSTHRIKDCTLANTKGELATCPLGPLQKQSGRCATSKGEIKGWKSYQLGSLNTHQAVSRLQVPNHMFLGSWRFISARSVLKTSFPEKTHCPPGTEPSWCIQEPEKCILGPGKCMLPRAVEIRVFHPL